MGEIKIALKKEMKTEGEHLVLEILQCRNITYKFKSPDHLPGKGKKKHTYFGLHKPHAHKKKRSKLNMGNLWLRPRMSENSHQIFMWNRSFLVLGSCEAQINTCFCERLASDVLHNHKHNQIFDMHKPPVSRRSLQPLFFSGKQPSACWCCIMCLAVKKMYIGGQMGNICHIWCKIHLWMCISILKHHFQWTNTAQTCLWRQIGLLSPSIKLWYCPTLPPLVQYLHSCARAAGRVFDLNLLPDGICTQSLFSSRQHSSSACVSGGSRLADAAVGRVCLWPACFGIFVDLWSFCTTCCVDLTSCTNVGLRLALQHLCCHLVAEHWKEKRRKMIPRLYLFLMTKEYFKETQINIVAIKLWFQCSLAHQSVTLARF